MKYVMVGVLVISMFLIGNATQSRGLDFPSGAPVVSASTQGTTKTWLLDIDHDGVDEQMTRTTTNEKDRLVITEVSGGQPLFVHEEQVKPYAEGVTIGSKITGKILDIEIVDPNTDGYPEVWFTTAQHNPFLGKKTEWEFNDYGLIGWEFNRVQLMSLPKTSERLPIDFYGGMLTAEPTASGVKETWYGSCESVDEPCYTFEVNIHFSKYDNWSFATTATNIVRNPKAWARYEKLHPKDAMWTGALPF